ncbi:MAG TPA: hypothetical protein VGB55_04090, partial [Tepidisphaeraceae bacterium]
VLRATSEAGLTSARVVGTVSRNVTAWRDESAQPNTRYYYKVVSFDTHLGEQRLRGGTNVATAVTVPENTDFVLRETVAIPVTGATVETLSDLVAGENYRVSVRGFFDLDANPNTAGRKRADAEYGRYIPLPDSHSMIGRRVKYGVGINDEELGLNRFPYWGDPASDGEHSYAIAYSPEQTGKLKLNYHDNFYPDNQPGYVMLVDIYRALPSAPGELNATPDRQNKRFELTWRNVARDYDRVVLERRIDNGAYEELALLPKGTSNYTDEDVLLNRKYSYRLRAFTTTDHSGYGNEAFGVLVNARPSVEPLRPLATRVGEEVSLQVVGSDPDGPTDELTYTVTGTFWAPAIDANGVISDWTPTTNDIGMSEVWKITVSDVDGGVTEQYLTVTVLPALLTIPSAVTAAHVVSQTPTTATLEVTGVDDGSSDNLTFTWRVTKRPFNTPLPTIVGTKNGAISQAAVTFKAAGTYEFMVEIGDGSDYTGSSRVTVIVDQALGAVEVTEPLLALRQGDQHAFKALARDQFERPWNPLSATQPVFVWSIASPSLGTVNATTGQYVAPSAAPPVVTDTLQVTATFGDETRTALAQVTVRSTPNVPPVMYEIAPDEPNIDAEAISLTQMRLTASAFDPDGLASDLTYTWSVESQPAGSPAVRFSRNGSNAAAETFATVSADYPMNYEFHVVVADKHGGTTLAEITLTGDGELTRVLLTPADAMTGVGKMIRYQASARDGVNRKLLPVPTYQWAVDGVNVAGATSDVFDYLAPATAGKHTVSVTATSGSISITAQAAVNVLAPTPPVLKITSPAVAARVNDVVLIDKDTPISLVVDDLDDDGVEWHLWLRDAEGRRTRVAGGTEELGAAPSTGAMAYTLRPTMHANGLYTLELTDSASLDAPVIDSRRIEVRTQYKLGGLRLPFIDGQIELPAGEPLTATRVYDSTLAHVKGDFGYGWSLQMNDDTFRTTARPGSWTHQGVPAFRSNDIVYLTTPDGQQHAFAFRPKKNTNSSGTIASVVSYSPRFVTFDGSRAELTVPLNATVHGNTGLPIELRSDPATGEWFYSIGTGNIGAAGGYNPSKANPGIISFGNSYRLKTDDGTVYQYDGSGRLKSSEDPNGNVVDYTTGGSSDGRKFAVRRDEANGNRITGISEVPGSSFDGTPDPTKFVEYTYNDDGDLWKVRDRAQNVTTFTYERIDGLSTHRLIKITDARGVAAVSATYDPVDHTLKELVDAAGAASRVTTGPVGTGGHSGQRVEDAAGGRAELIYNDHGDVIREIRQIREGPGGAVSGYQVSVREYSYGVFDARELMLYADRFGVTHINKRMWEKEHAPFVIAGADSAGLRYTQVPAAGVKPLREVEYNKVDLEDDRYYLVPGFIDPGLFQPRTQSVLGA